MWTHIHVLVHSAKTYRVPNMCCVLSVTGINEKCVRYTLNLLSQWVIHTQCYSSGLRELLSASFLYIPTPLADCIVIFDRVLNLYFYYIIFLVDCFSTHFLNIFLSFLLPPLLFSFFLTPFLPSDHFLTSQLLFLFL